MGHGATEMMMTQPLPTSTATMASAMRGVGCRPWVRMNRPRGAGAARVGTEPHADARPAMVPRMSMTNPAAIGDAATSTAMMTTTRFMAVTDAYTALWRR